MIFGRQRERKRESGIGKISVKEEGKRGGGGKNSWKKNPGHALIGACKTKRKSRPIFVAPGEGRGK